VIPRCWICHRVPHQGGDFARWRCTRCMVEWGMSYAGALLTAERVEHGERLLYRVDRYVDHAAEHVPSPA